MSVLTGKNILIVEEGGSSLENLENELKQRSIIYHKFGCDEATAEKLDELDIDLIVLDLLNEKEKCMEMLALLRKLRDSKPRPVFVLVDDDNDKIQAVISAGAADYITPADDSESIVQKMTAVFTDTETSFGSSAIDITPVEASVSSTGIRVFVIEDDPLLRNLLSLRLEKSSFPFEFSNDGKGVLPVMHQFKPDVIVLDLMLPGRSGFEVLQEIREDEKLKDLPVIVFSNRDGQEDKKKAQELGASAFFVKAMTDLSELVEKIESLVKK